MNENEEERVDYSELVAVDPAILEEEEEEEDIILLPTQQT